MGHRTLKGAVCKDPCFLDDPKLKTVKIQTHSKEGSFQFMDITNFRIKTYLKDKRLEKSLLIS